MRLKPKLGAEDEVELVDAGWDVEEVAAVEAVDELIIEELEVELLLVLDRVAGPCDRRK